MSALSDGLIRFFGGPDVAAVIASLRSEPEAWSARIIGGEVYALEHPNGLEIWTANSLYGMQIRTPCRRKIWGGVTALSAFAVSPAHWIIWAATRPFVRCPLPPITAASILAKTNPPAMQMGG